MIVIIVSVFLTWSGVLGNEFVNWDDNYLLVYNEAYRGLSLSHLHWMFTTHEAGHYQPLTWLSYAIDYLIWGRLNSAGVHLSNLLLHLATALCLLFVIIRILQAARPTYEKGSITAGATFATLLFVLHPLRVESVAWATERRDVLSGLLIMLTLIFYLRSVQDRKTNNPSKNFCLALMCFCASLLCKASGMILPGVLFILDVYPLGRFDRCCGAGTNNSAHQLDTTLVIAENAGEIHTHHQDDVGPQTVDSLPRCLLEKLAFLIPAGLSAIAAVWAQQGVGALRTSMEHPFALRVAQAFYGVFFYVWKTIWPSGLIPLYEQRVGATPWDNTYLLSALFVLAFTIAAWSRRKNAPAVLAAWLSYMVILLPMLGFAQSGPQVVADRYSYLACIPWAILAGAAVATCWRSQASGCMPNPKLQASSSQHQQLSATERAKMVTPSFMRSPRRVITAVICVGLLGTLAYLTKKQVLIWHDSIALWNATIEQAPNTGTAYANLASALNSRGDYVLAKHHGLRALEILPGNRIAHLAVAHAAANLGDYLTAKQHLDLALTIRPVDPIALASLIDVESSLGDLSAAKSHCQKLINLQPLDGHWHAALGTILAKENRMTDAIEAFARALQLSPELTDVRFRLASLQVRRGLIKDAIVVLEQGIRSRPNKSELLAKLSWVLATTNSPEFQNGQRALKLANRALGVSPHYAPALEAKAAAYAREGHFHKAIALLESAMGNHEMPLGQARRTRWISFIEQLRRNEPLQGH